MTNPLRLVLLLTAILSVAVQVKSQEQESKFVGPTHSLPRSCDHEEQLRNSFLKVEEAAEQLPCSPRFEENISPVEFFEAAARRKQTEIEEVISVRQESRSSPVKQSPKFHWKAALVQSTVFLGLQHGFRVLMQKDTRAGLRGPFFRDWQQSVKNLRGWNDGNSFFINYIAHTLQGGITGRIFVNNSDLASTQVFGKSKRYWKSRFKALAWSTAWSVQFELGVLSEANIGNVGLKPKPSGHSGMAYVDQVVTPVIGTSLLVVEDAIDRYILRDRIEKHGYRKRTIKILRSVLTPTTTIGNLLRLQVPWKRNNR
jgi:hypothetical protein